MTPKDAWLYAASWGSFMTNGDPGACMYGFDEHCRPQSEEHRTDVMNHLETVCVPMVQANPEDYDDDELDTMAEFLKFIKKRRIMAHA